MVTCLVLGPALAGALQVIEVPRLEVAGIDAVAGRHVPGRVGGAVDLVLKTPGPGGVEAEQLIVVAQFELVAVLLALVPYQVGGRAVHPAVVGVVLVGLQVAIVALAVQVVEGVAQAGAGVDPVVDDRAQPHRALLIQAIGDVVVVEAVVLVDLQLTGLGA